MYQWGLLLWWIILMPVAYYVLKRVKWDPYIRFHGLHFAKKNDSSACLITDDTGDTHMLAEHIAKCIFSYGEDDYEIEIPEMRLHLIKSAGIIAALLGLVLARNGSLLNGIIFIAIGAAGYFVEKIVPWIYQKIFWYPTKYLDDIDWQQALLYKIGNINFDCKIAQKLQNGEWAQYPVVNAAGITVEWTFDPNNWCRRKSPAHKAIVKSAREWNKDNPGDQVHTYIKYQRYLNEGNILAPAGVSKDYLVPWVRIDNGYPINLRNVDEAGKIRQMAKTKENKPNAEANKYTIWLILAGIGLFIIVLLARFLMKLLTTPH